jgi:putative oxidoreductase
MSKPKGLLQTPTFNSTQGASLKRRQHDARYVRVPSSTMNTLINLLRRVYELLVASGNLLQSPLLLVLRVYFFWQLFMTGQGHLAHIGKVSDFFVSLGIPFPMLNAYLSSSVECFGSLLLIVGLASRLTAIPVTITMAVAYLTADLEAVTSIFSDPDKFVKADPFPYFICALIILVFGPGRFSIDALIKWSLGGPRRRETEDNSFAWSSQTPLLRRFFSIRK